MKLQRIQTLDNVKSITVLNKELKRLNDIQYAKNTVLHGKNKKTSCTYIPVKSTHSTLTHTEHARANTCLTVLPRKTSTSKSNKIYLI